MLSESLKQNRIKSGLTQASVAKALGVSPRAYQHYENGTREPNVEKLIQLADLFSISLDELVGRVFP